MASYSLKYFNRYNNVSVPEYARKESLDIFSAPVSRYMNIFGVFPYNDSSTHFVQNLVFYDVNPGIKILPVPNGFAPNSAVQNNFKATVKKSWIEFSWCKDDDESFEEFDTSFAVEVVLFAATSSSASTVSTRLYDRIQYFNMNHPCRFEIPDIVDVQVSKAKSIFIGVSFTPLALNSESQPVVASANFNVNSELNVIIDEEYTPVVTP